MASGESETSSLDSSAQAPSLEHAFDGGEGGVELGSFDAKYLGSVSVKSAMGNDVCADAVLRIRAHRHTEKKVRLVITSRGVFVVDAKSKENIKEAVITQVSFTSQDSIDKKLFSYITHEPTTGLMMCHAFSVKKNVKQIPSTLNQAFMINSGKIEAPKGSKFQIKRSQKEALAHANEIKEASRRESRSVAVGVFAAKYLGSVAVREPRGNEIALDALARIKSLKQEARSVEIVVTPQEVEVVEAKSNNVIKTVPIMEMSFTAVHPKDQKLVLWITSDNRLGLMYCHAFQSKKIKGQEILDSIGESFGKAKDLVSSGDASVIREMGAMAVQGPSNAMGVFDAKFIGSVPAADLKGADVVEQCIQDVKHVRRHAEGVVMTVSAEGIRTIEGLTGEVLNSILISDVSFCTTSGARKEILAFISKDTRLKRVTCHIYECLNAHKVTAAIGEAFQSALRVQQDRASNPFAAEGEREPVKGVLFKKQLHRKDLQAVKPIGAGQFGQVYLGKLSGALVAVKTVRQGASAADKDEFVKEAEVMVELENPHLCKLIGVAIQQRPWLCVIEFMKYGDLRDVLQTCDEKKFELSTYEQVYLAQQLAEGLAFMASKRYIHMDIAARNCLLADNNKVKVADFGLTRKLDVGKDTYTLRKTAKLPIRWMAIETLTSKVFSQASDVWAFGVLMWEIVGYGALPYTNVKNREVQKHITSGNRLSEPERGCPSDLMELMGTCWRDDPAQRLPFGKLADNLIEMAKKYKGSSEERDIGATLMGL